MQMKFFVTAVVILSASALSGQTWTIGNEQIERKVTFAPATGLVTERLFDLSTHTEYIGPESAPKSADEFSFLCNGQLVKGSGSGFELINGKESKLPSGKQLTIALRSKAFPLDVSILYRVYDGHPAVRKRLILHNTGKSPLQITHLDIEAISPAVGLSNETVLNAGYGAAPQGNLLHWPFRRCRPAACERAHGHRLRRLERSPRIHEAHRSERMAQSRPSESWCHV